MSDTCTCMFWMPTDGSAPPRVVERCPACRDRELLDVIAGLVQQHCRKDSDGVVESGFIGINAIAIDILCEHGIMELTHPDTIGRGRWAKWSRR